MSRRNGREPGLGASSSLRCRPSSISFRGASSDYAEVWRLSGLTGSNLQIIGDHKNGDHQRRIDELSNNGRWYRQARNPSDFRVAKSRGGAASFLSYQSIPTTVDDLAWFDEAADLGVRMAGLTYNHINQFGAGCTSQDDGLTPFGRETVKRMNERGMIVDVAHAGPHTTLDACHVSKRPVVASHTGAEALYPHARNKSDEELKALADTGGLIGVVAVPMFLTTTLPGRLDLTLDHIDYIADLVGIDAVAIGTDWPMELPLWVTSPGGPFEAWTRDMGFRAEDLERLDVNIEGFDDYRDWPNITRGLVGRGYTDEEVAKIVGGNALRVFEAVWE